MWSLVVFPSCVYYTLLAGRLSECRRGKFIFNWVFLLGVCVWGSGRKEEKLEHFHHHLASADDGLLIVWVSECDLSRWRRMVRNFPGWSKVFDGERICRIKNSNFVANLRGASNRSTEIWYFLSTLEKIRPKQCGRRSSIDWLVAHRTYRGEVFEFGAWSKIIVQKKVKSEV